MSAARALGVALQALILGLLLAVAIGRLVSLSVDARVFKYQAY